MKSSMNSIQGICGEKISFFPCLAGSVFSQLPLMKFFDP